VARRIDTEARDRQLIVYSTQPTRDGFAGDQTLLAPAFVASDSELDEIVQRVSDTVHAVAGQVKNELGAPGSPSAGRYRSAHGVT
jgi:adenosylmethionine-8-amino-7-oxononanoate aminotransferase